MKPQIQVFRQSEVYVLLGVKALRSRFCDLYEALHNRADGLLFSQCSKAEQAEIRTSGSNRRADRLNKSGGVFMLVTWQSFLLPFYGGLLAGSRKACRILLGGCSKPDSSPRLSIRTERGNIGNLIGGYMPKHTQNAHGRTALSKCIGATIPHLYSSSIIGLHSCLSVKATDTGLRNLKTTADNRQGKSQSGFLFIRNLSHLLMGVACSCDLSHGFRCGRISQDCNAMPTRLRNGRMVSQLNTTEAYHA